jgi:hypothetical protein
MYACRYADTSEYAWMYAKTNEQACNVCIYKWVLIIHVYRHEYACMYAYAGKYASCM